MRPESRVPGFFQEAHLKSQNSPSFPCISVVLKPLQDYEITHREPKFFQHLTLCAFKGLAACPKLLDCPQKTATILAETSNSVNIVYTPNQELLQVFFQKAHPKKNLQTLWKLQIFWSPSETRSKQMCTKHQTATTTRSVRWIWSKLHSNFMFFFQKKHSVQEEAGFKMGSTLVYDSDEHQNSNNQPISPRNNHLIQAKFTSHHKTSKHHSAHRHPSGHSTTLIHPSRHWSWQRKNKFVTGDAMNCERCLTCDLS